jgi:hypothetical protein
MIPGVRGVIASKEEARAFHETEANCNTCKHLKRVQHEKDRHGFLYGQCGHNPFGHMFVMKFHPDDPMHMRCYVPRWHDEQQPYDSFSVWATDARTVALMKRCKELEGGTSHEPGESK